MTITGDILTIEVDLSKDFDKSSSGKSIVIATTEGNKTVKDDIKIGLNIYKPVKE
jgi:hypothetical protein